MLLCRVNFSNAYTFDSTVSACIFLIGAALVLPEDFDILSEITEIQTMVVNRSIRELEQLNRQYGIGRWRKRKGFAIIRYKRSGRVVEAEIHWYEAHGIGAVKWKVKNERRK